MDRRAGLRLGFRCPGSLVVFVPAVVELSVAPDALLPQVLDSPDSVPPPSQPGQVGSPPLFRIVAHRTRVGPFRRRAGLRDVTRLGVDVKRYLDEAFGVGLPTLHDIVAELRKPGRDPRAELTAVDFNAAVSELGHLQVGMNPSELVTNVAAFGAFVDVGVHQDGLVHISDLAPRFVKDAAEIVKVGDRVRMKVLSVDLARKRIGLSIKALQAPPAAAPRPSDAARAPFNAPRSY